MLSYFKFSLCVKNRRQKRECERARVFDLQIFTLLNRQVSASVTNYANCTNRRNKIIRVIRVIRG